MEIKQSAELEELIHQLTQTQAFLQSFLGLPPLLICVLQPTVIADSAENSFPIAFLSPDWQTVMAWDLEALKGQNWFAWVHPEDASQNYLQLQSLLRSLPHSLLHSSQTYCQFENRMRYVSHKDGKLPSPEGYQTFSWQFRRGTDGLLYGTATQGIRTLSPTKQSLTVDPLQRMLERERLFTTISQRIRQTLDLSEVLKTTVTEIRHFLKSDRVAIFQFEPDWNGKVVVESVRSGCPSILNRVVYDPCFKHLWHEPYLEGRIQQIEDVYQENLEPCYRDMLSQFYVRANLVIPILQNNLRCELSQEAPSPQQERRLWGLLLVHQYPEPRQWRQEEVSLLTQLTAQVAVAIQQSELYQEVNQLNTTLEAQVQRRTKQLQQAFEFEATLKRITDKVRDSLDESQILQTAIRELALALNISSCDTGIYNLQEKTSTIAYEYIQRDVPPAKGRTIPIEIFPEYYQPLLQGKYLQFCWHNTVYVSGAPVRSIRDQFAVLACPIQDDQEVLGDLCLYKDSNAIYEEQEIRLVQQVANQCAIALRQARLYQAAQRQVIELERLNYLKDDFLNTISHELRTPVSNIKMAAGLLEIHLKQMRLLSEGSVIERHFEILKHETQREINLINDLLDLSRLDANTEPLLLTTIDLGMWIHHVVEPFIERAHIQQQTLEVHVPDTLPLLTTDLTDLERIVSELLDNACKFTPAGETIALSVTQATDPTALQLSIRNCGIEIPLVEQSRIFEKFYRIPSSDPWKHDGVGLGLALVKKLAERLGATIQIESGKLESSKLESSKLESSKLESGKLESSKLESSDRHTTFVLTIPIGQSVAG